MSYDELDKEMDELLERKFALNFVSDSNLVETEYTEVIMRVEDIAYSKALQMFKTHTEEVQASIWSLFSIPEANLLQDMQTFLNTDVVQQTMRGDVRPLANAEIFLGIAPLVTLATDDDAFKMLQKLIKAVDVGGKHPTIIIKDKDSDVTISQYLENTTNLTTAYVQSMIVSLKRLTSRDAGTSRYMDLVSDLATYNVSFSMFEMVESLFEVQPDPDNAIMFNIPGDIGRTLLMRQKCHSRKDFIVQPFSNNHYDLWCAFLESMDEHRPGFSKLLCCMMYPWFLEDLVNNLPLVTDELYAEIDHELVQVAAHFVQDDELVMEHPSSMLETDLDFKEIVRPYDTPERFASLGIENNGYGVRLWNKDPGVQEKEVMVNLKIDFPAIEPVIDLVSNAIHSGEVLRVVRAQNDKKQDDDTNTSASPFIGSLENAYMRLWIPMLDFEPKEFSCYGDISTMPYHDKYTKTNPVSSLDLDTFVINNYDSNRLNYIDALRVFDTDYDGSIRARYRKRWTKGYMDDDLYVMVAASILVAAKKKKAMTIFRLPMFNSSTLPALILTLYGKIGFKIIPAKKAHDPFFFLVMHDSIPKMKSEVVLKRILNLSLYFVRGVIERHLCYENHALYYYHQWSVNRFRDWVSKGIEISFDTRSKIKGMQYKIVKINPLDRKKKSTNARVKKTYSRNQTMLEQERYYEEMLNIAKPEKTRTLISRVLLPKLD